MKVKTSEVKSNILIRVYADLTGWDSTETLLKDKILNTPYKFWKIDEFNLMDLGNDEVADIFVYESINEIIFNVNSVF